MTPQMQRTLSAFLAYFDEHGVAPTIRQLASIEGASSTSHVHQRLCRLADDGHLIRRKGRERGFAPKKPNLSGITTADLQAELARREKRHG